MNLDPGYLAAGKLVLATTKNQQHRIYLGQGIFAEVALRYRAGAWQPWEWTYRDYRSPEYARSSTRSGASSCGRGTRQRSAAAYLEPLPP